MENTDFYQQIHSAAGQTIFPMYAKLKRLRKTTEDIQSKIDDETKVLAGLQDRLERLQSEPFNVVDGEPFDTTGFKKGIMKIQAEISASEQALKALENLLTEKQKDRDEQHRQIERALLRLLREQRPATDANMNDLLKEAIAVWNGFQDAFIKLFGEYNCGLVFNDESLLPGPMTVGEIKDIERRIAEWERNQRVLSEAAEPPVNATIPAQDVSRPADPADSTFSAEIAPEVPQNKPLYGKGQAAGDCITENGGISYPGRPFGPDCELPDRH
jgi:DNA repair exonuclease SbcCD ATPase subunit